MNKKINLWPDSYDPGIPADDFVPYLETSLLEDSSKPLGMVVVLPGGGYRVRAEHEGMPIAKKFNELGYHAAVVQYRVSPWTYPAPQQDAVRAIAIIRANAEKWNVDPDHIAICGFSAGGHLACSCGTIAMDIDRSADDMADAFSGRPDAMILCYPVISNDPEIAHLGSFAALSGQDEPDDDFLAMTRLEDHVSADTPPAFLWHTATDNAVPVQNSLRFAEAMREQDKPAELHIYPEGVHGLGLAEDKVDIRTWPLLAANFLERTAAFPRKTQEC